MTHLILHIGHPKTGTTALQTVLSTNADRLLEAGVLYPTKAKPSFHNHALAKPALTGCDDHVIRGRYGLEGDELRRLSERYWDSVKAETKQHSHDTLILSWEWLWDVDAARSEYFRKRLLEVCDHITAVGYLRDPARFFLSMMNQRIRMFRGILLFQEDYYRSVIDAYRENGFETSINVFESAHFANGDIVTDFCTKYLRPDLPALERGGNAERGNESISNEAMVILQEVARAHSTSSPDASPDARDSRRSKTVRIVYEADRALGGNLRPSLKPEIEAAQVARSTDLIWLRDEAGIQFANVDYDLVGTTGHPDLASLHSVEDFSPIDPDRLAALRAMTERKIARVYGRGAPVYSLVRRWFGSTTP
ncbi:MAG: hypothetical protein M9895_13995 [Aquamicrobium sp.]|uniref:hypothetical protein n=1 Tax=Aquamicrobium sp. TaxID=1872579 RepID=UPI00349E9116|nr:hypothetical protein [Aquamicrobium sp.]MCO5156797.1 hypothetical protein [Aquamicrobium sp.]